MFVPRRVNRQYSYKTFSVIILRMLCYKRHNIHKLLISKSGLTILITESTLHLTPNTANEIQQIYTDYACIQNENNNNIFLHYLF